MSVANQMQEPKTLKCNQLYACSRTHIFQEIESKAHS